MRILGGNFFKKSESRSFWKMASFSTISKNFASDSISEIKMHIHGQIGPLTQEVIKYLVTFIIHL